MKLVIKGRFPIRVLIVDGKLINGGVEAFIMNIYRRIDKSKIQFDFLLHYKDKYYYDDEVTLLGGKIFRLSFRNDNNILKYLKDLRNFFKSKNEYRVVWGHMDGLASVYMNMAKFYGNTITIAHSHITDSENNLKGLVKRILRIGINKCTDYRFACSTEAGKYLYGNADFRLVHNAIDTKKFSYNKDIRDKIRIENNWTDKKVIGHVGRFFLQKNHRFLIDVFKHVVSKDNKYVLCLCGEGDLFEEIKNLVDEYNISNNVVFMGNVKNINEIYQAMDVFVMPSLYEGLPVSGIEAQTSGLKCIFSDTITREVAIIPENVRFVSLSCKAEKWAQTIIDISNYKRFDCTNRVIEYGYDIDTLVKNIENFILNLKI